MQFTDTIRNLLPAVGWAITTLLPTVCVAQSDVAAKPIVGLRDNRPNDYALTGATVVTRPGQSIDNATVLIRDTTIIGVGQDLAIPAGFMSIDCSGRTIYAGLIDAFSEAEVPMPDSSSAGHWNSNVVPQRSAKDVAVDSSGDREKLRSQGITARVVAPKSGIIKGHSSLVLLGDGDSGRRLIKEDVWQHCMLTVPRDRTKSKYPNSPMGATALLRQTLYDAKWYGEAWAAYRSTPTLPRPETNNALAALSTDMQQGTFVADASNERMAIRADKVADEFSLKMILRGSGREYRDLEAIAATGRAVLVPIDFPDKPFVETAAAARNTDLRELMHWDLAPENPARLESANVPICLTTDGLENVGEFRKQVTKAIDRGLSGQGALAAVTTTPATLLGLDAVIGKVETGMLANLVITDGPLFDEETKVLETWVAGNQFIIDAAKSQPQDALVGEWDLQLAIADQSTSLELAIEQNEDGKLEGTVSIPGDDDQPEEQPAANSEDESDGEEEGGAGENEKEAGAGEDKEKPVTKTKLDSIVRQQDRLTATVSLSELEAFKELEADIAGVSTLTLVVVESDTPSIDVFGKVRFPDGRVEKLTLTKGEPGDDQDEESSQTDEEETEETDEESTEDSPTPSLYPIGAYGLTAVIDETPTVLFKGATIWTCGAAGVIENGEVLIKDGKVVAVGNNLARPAVCHVYDATGKHITPGLIDAHSHMGTDGGVNESGQAVTAEVRIGDFIDNSDINIYRQLAGGVTTSNILHGSANPIGGQNQVIKLRWGQSMDGLRMTEAPGGIKFALGENVKRTTTRYPNTRMGVEQIIRDQLLAAREYDSRWRRWRAGERTGLPPRRDLQLEALAEVQRGERWIHCHSYRQDEIVATLDVLDEFGIQIGTLQHILEGYKVADRMAKHDAMGSAFSDWWAYKFEVFDAIPYNGALMHEQGVVVSFNSDDRELARHLNTEAAKAMKYGGVSAEDALKFVTLNPAKQLRIEQHVGSLSPGKHADLVIWSGPPLSTMSRCEQTWIDGQRYFDLESDAKLRDRDTALHAQLVQKVLSDGGKRSGKKKEEQVDEEDRWARHDIYCGAHGGSGHLQTNWERGQ